jgi:hypothetical protein
MDEELFHRLVVAEYEYMSARYNALKLQASSKNGMAVKAAFDIARDREYAYKYVFDKYIQNLMDVNMEFV